jgi:hypothetical protein
MLRWPCLAMFRSSECRANGLAAGIALATIGWLALESPPAPVAADGIRVANRRAPALRLAATSAPQALANVVEPVAPPVAEALSPQEQSLRALRKKMEMLERGRQFLDEIPDYTAQFSKQELVDGELLEEQTMLLKCRHKPFSIYLQWLTGDVGRELLYVEGTNDGEMLVHGGGWKARLPALSISPTSSLAMKESRYPVTSAGLKALVDIILRIHADDLVKNNIERCDQLPDQDFDGRKCAVFVVYYKNAELSPTYRKSIVLIDKAWNIPLYTRNFCWPADQAPETAEELDDATLIEFYTFTDIQFRQQLAEVDFDRTNAEYRFR